MYTKPWIPSPTKPKNSRLIASMTTLPQNFAYMRPTLDSILGQSVRFDAAYVGIPNTSLRFNTGYTVPLWFRQYQQPSVILKVLDTDYGPLSKLAVALLYEHSSDTMIITFDDDKIYSPHVSRFLVSAGAGHPRTAFGACGWAFSPTPPPWEILPVYVLWMMRGSGRFVDVLQGVCGVVYQVSFFEGNIQNFLRPPAACFKSDDIWIAGTLAMANVSRVLLGGQMVGWHGLDPANADTNTKRSDKLSYAAEKRPRRDIACVRAVEKRFGKSWTWASSRVADGEL